MLCPEPETFIKKRHGYLGLDQMLMLCRSGAHGLRGCRASGSRHQRRVKPRPTHQSLRCAVGRFEQSKLSLQACERQHAILLQRCRELLRRQTIDLVSAVSDEIE